MRSDDNNNSVQILRAILWRQFIFKSHKVYLLVKEYEEPETALEEKKIESKSDKNEENISNTLGEKNRKNKKIKNQ